LTTAQVKVKQNRFLRVIFCFAKTTLEAFTIVIFTGHNGVKRVEGDFTL